MAGSIGLKLGGMIEGICKNNPVNHEILFLVFGKPRWPPNGLYSKKECFVFLVCLWFINSEMAGPIMLKVGGMIEDICENNLAKDFFLNP